MLDGGRGDAEGGFLMRCDRLRRSQGLSRYSVAKKWLSRAIERI